jgi:hypothetical protein
MAGRCTYKSIIKLKKIRSGIIREPLALDEPDEEEGGAKIRDLAKGAEGEGSEENGDRGRLSERLRSFLSSVQYISVDTLFF